MPLFCLFLLSVPLTSPALSCGSNQKSVDGLCLCVSGYFCPPGGTATQCPVGYTSNLGASNLNECYVARGVILNVSIDYVSMNLTESTFLRGLPQGVGLVSYEDELMIYVDNCPSGYWCEDQSGMPTACVAGTYQPDLGGASVSDCKACPMGHFCAAATTTPVNCPGGTFGATEGLSPGDCVTCPAGSFCSAGSYSATPAPAGSYIGQSGASSSSYLVTCPPGYFCLEGSSAPVPCVAGTYRTAAGGVDDSSCVVCPTGSYCGTGSSVPTPCAAGTHNGMTGSVSTSACVACLPGSYCSAGTAVPTFCPQGTYSSTTRAETNATCLICPTGSFCGEGSSAHTPCAAGTFGSLAGGISQSSCTECPSGSYCPTGVSQPVQCGPGTYAEAPGSIHQQDCVLCPPGPDSMSIGRSTNCPACVNMSYCPTSTIIIPCPQHTSSAPGSYSLAGCTCDEGFGCLTKKEIHATVRVNATKTDFTADVGGVRTSFVNAVAGAANVTSDMVTILSISESRRRRLLSAASNIVTMLSTISENSCSRSRKLLSHPHTKVVQHRRDGLAESLRVQAALKQAQNIRNLRKRFEAPALRGQGQAKNPPLAQDGKRKL